MGTINWNELRDRAYQNAVNHGFHDENHSSYHYLMIVVTELGEAVEADRKGKYAQRRMFEDNYDTPQVNPDSHWMFCFETFIKDTVEDELADAAIRLFDFAGSMNLNIHDHYFTEGNYSVFSKIFLNRSFPDILYRVVLSLDYNEYYNPSSSLLYLFAIAYHLGLDLQWHIEQKMKYNEMRPYKHGKKY